MNISKTKILTLLLLTAVVSANALPAINTILSSARAKIGSPYRNGATGPSSFDCSGFIYYLFHGSLPQLPRRSASMGRYGQPVTADELIPGDIVLYATTGDNSKISHVALYLGNNSIIHAISDGPNRGVSVTSMNARYWRTRYHSARRIMPGNEVRSASNTSPKEPEETAQEDTSGYIAFAKGRYAGGLKFGEPHGRGVFEFANGDVYRGGFYKGSFHGKGTYTWKDGTVFVDSFSKGEPSKPLPENRKLYMNIEDSPWETWDGNVWGDFNEWRDREESDFEAYKKRDTEETNKRR